MTTTYKSYGGMELDLDESTVTLRATNKLSKALLTSTEEVGLAAGSGEKVKWADTATFARSEVHVAKFRDANALVNGAVELQLPDRKNPVKLSFRRKDRQKFAELNAQLGG